MKIWIVDAFTKTRFSGNPAGVCIVEQICDLDEKLMQSIASEFRISEIAFVKHLNKQHYSIRWFTPNSEAPICGHATVAAMHILTELGIEEKGIYIKFDSISGTLSAINTFRTMARRWAGWMVGPRGGTPPIGGPSPDSFILLYIPEELRPDSAAPPRLSVPYQHCYSECRLQEFFFHFTPFRFFNLVSFS